MGAKRAKTCMQRVRTHSYCASISHTIIGGWVREKHILHTPKKK